MPRAKSVFHLYHVKSHPLHRYDDNDDKNNVADADGEFVGVFVSELMHLLHVLLAFLEAPEVVLDEERGVELADRDLVVAGWRNHLVQKLGTGALPHLCDDATKFFVCLVDVACPRQLYPVYTIQQTYSKLPTNVFKIHVLIARRLLDVCWTSAGLCKLGITHGSFYYSGGFKGGVGGGHPLLLLTSCILKQVKTLHKMHSFA